MKLFGRLFSFLLMIWCFIVLAAMMLVMFPFVIAINLIFSGKRAQALSFVCLRIWAGVFLVLGLFRLVIKNKHYSDPKGSYIYVCNHGSYLDAIAIVLSAPQAFKPLGKKELVKIPIFGWMYRNLVVMVDRSSPESRAKSVEALIADLRSGQSLFIFPEGTMNRSDEPLGPFYDGAFRIAIETQTPIAPMVLINASKLLHRDHPTRIKPGTMTMVFMPPVPVAGMVMDDLPKLKQQVKQLMEEQILAYA